LIALTQASDQSHHVVITFPSLTTEVNYILSFKMGGVQLGTALPNPEDHSPYTVTVLVAAVSAVQTVLYGSNTAVTAGAVVRLTLQVCTQ
jgi:hypothetical protein